MDVRLTWTDCDEAGDYVVPNVLSPRDLVSRPDNMDETVLHTHSYCAMIVPDRREADACLIMLRAKQSSHWYHLNACGMARPGI